MFPTGLKSADMEKAERVPEKLVRLESWTFPCILLLISLKISCPLDHCPPSSYTPLSLYTGMVMLYELLYYFSLISLLEFKDKMLKRFSSA